jgi:hypothetical protein
MNVLDKSAPVELLTSVAPDPIGSSLEVKLRMLFLFASAAVKLYRVFKKK